ncbi:MAG: hypothetical protein RIC06_00400 [Cyclobacteriaceae bacterium]
MQNEKDLSNALGKTLRQDNLTNLGVGIGEVLTDSFLDDGTLKEIPILGTLIGIAKTGLSLRDCIFQT